MAKRPCPEDGCTEQIHPKSLSRHIKRKHLQPAPSATERQDSQPASLATTNVLFIAIPANEDIRKDDANTVRFSFYATDNDDRNIQMLGGQRGLHNLKKSLDKSLVTCYRNTWYIHQLLATIIIAANKFEAKWQLQLQKWDWAIPLIRSGTLLDNLQDRTQIGQTVLFVSSTSADWPGMSQPEFLDALYSIVAGHSHLRVYPSIAEQRFEMLKIPDIRALDAIAAARDCPDEFSTRPTTCYGRGKCALSQLKHEDYHVLKRSESCASWHVILKKSIDRGELRCTLSGNSVCDNETRQNRPSHLWFHQQFVPDLDRFEFRVFIKNNGKGYEVFHTLWTSSPQLERGVPEAQNTIVATRASLDNFRWAVPDGVSPMIALDTQRAKQKELHEFALYVHGALLRRPDAKDHFETLEVGVRLDIGVFNGQFFVNEITRWPEADWFSESTVETPYTRICSEYAEALARYLA